MTERNGHDIVDDLIRNLVGRPGSGPRMSPGDVGAAMHKMFEKAALPDRQGNDLTPDRSEAIDKMTKGFFEVIAREAVRHGPDKRLDLIIQTAVSNVLLGLDSTVHPGMVRSVVSTLGIYDALTNSNDSDFTIIGIELVDAGSKLDGVPQSEREGGSDYGDRTGNRDSGDENRVR